MNMLLKNINGKWVAVATITLIAWMLIAPIKAFGAENNPQEKMKFWHAGTGGNCSICSWTAAEGVITEETPADFLKYIETEKHVGAFVSFHSPGGNLNAGLELGRIIRKHGIATQVGKTVSLELKYGGYGEWDGGGGF